MISQHHVDTPRKSKGTSSARIIGVLIGLCAILVGLAGAIPAIAEIQNEQIGLSPNHIFDDLLEGEDVDVLNGNVHLGIPLGPRYQLNDWFGYQVMLHYNSRIWKHECDALDPSQNCPGAIASDAYGVGFTIGFGRIYRDNDDLPGVYRYRKASGAESFFCIGSAPSSTCGTSPQSGDHWNSADDAGYTLDNEAVPIFFDGATFVATHERTRITFGHQITYGAPGEGGDPDVTREWYATRIETVERNVEETDSLHYITIDYQPSSSRLVRIKDSRDPSGTNFSIDFTGNTITFPHFNGQQAIYSLNYDTASITDPSDRHGTDPPVQVTRGRLRSIDLPEPGLSYDFEYNGFGNLTSWTLPTGATVQYHYTWYKSSEGKPYHSNMYLRSLELAGETYAWTYTRFGEGVIQSVDDVIALHLGEMSGSASNPWRVKVLDPVGNLTVYEFGFTPYESTGDYRCSPSCPTLWTDGLLQRLSNYAGSEESATRLVRREQYTYVADVTGFGTRYFRYKDDGNNSPLVDRLGVNVRLAETEVITPAGDEFPASSRRTIRSDWTNVTELGQYLYGYPALARLHQDFDNQQLYREDYYAYGTGSRVAAGYSYHEVRDAQGAMVRRTDRSMDLSGRIVCEVSRSTEYGIDSMDPGCADDQGLSLLGLQPGDVATRYVYDDSGSLQTKKITGTDSAFTENYNYERGALKEASYAGLSVPWKAVDRDLDLNTGLPIRSRDPAAVVIEYDWDRLGRLVSATPRVPEAPTIVEYDDGPGPHRARVAQAGGAEMVYEYDALGRQVCAAQLTPTDEYEFQKTTYNVLGYETGVSQWTAASPGDDAEAACATPDEQIAAWTRTEYEVLDPNTGAVISSVDPLGRVSRTVLPDTDEASARYSGLATTVTANRVVTESGPISADTTYVYDVFGRLIEVLSPAGGARTTYDYDELDNLVEVQQEGDGPLDPTQIRRFQYDRLGRLRFATHPENGTIEYLEYDSRGKLRKFRDAQQMEFTLEYDAAGRLLTKTVEIGGQSQPLVENTYDTGSGAVEGQLTEQRSYELRSNGPQLVATRANYFGDYDDHPICGFTIAQGNAYIGLNGRFRRSTLRIEPWNRTLSTDYCHDATGAINVIAYPTESVFRTRTILQYQHSNGRLTSLEDLGRDTTYVHDLQYTPQVSVLPKSEGLSTYFDQDS